MDFFEKAHVPKSGSSSRKNNKSEENMKKELKQMLYGYQHKDHNLIKGLEKPTDDFEESSSVSGYSDLNLTHSSIEADISQDTTNSDFKDLSDIENSELSMDKSPKNYFDNAEENHSHSSNSESTSDYGEDVQSLTEDVSNDQVDAAVLSDSSEEDLGDSFIETSTDIDSTSNDESYFDPDGLLASKILQNMKKAKKDKPKPKKRKFEAIVKEEITIKNISAKKYIGPFRPKDSDLDSDDAKIDDLSLDISNISIPESKVFPGPYRPQDSSSEKELNMSDHSFQNDYPMDSSQSSPYVSVQAMDMCDRSLDDIIGEYKHPTIRNLPSASQIDINNDLRLFEIENANIVDIQTEDEVNSLIPEIDNTQVDELDLELTDLNQSTEPIDESTTYDDAMQSEHTSERELSAESIDLSVVSTVKVYYGKNQNCIFVLKHPTEIYLHGKVKIKCLGGTMQVLGYTLQDSTYEVYAPNYNYAHCLKTVENLNAYCGLFSKLTSAGITVAEAEEIVTSIGEFDGVIQLQPLRSRQMDFVENNFNVTDLFSKSNKNIDNCFKKASELLGCSLYLTKPLKTFNEDASWSQAIDCGFTPQSRGIVCGGKGVGKSTFLRYYVNRLLEKGPVLVIDLDPGQCEFTVAGNVSATVVKEPLLGPNFTHLRTPEIMLNIGMINTMDNPRRYAAAVESIITHCLNDENLKQMPWIVNSMGMTNTVGLKFMSLIILQTKPTFLQQIDSRIAKKRYDFHLYPQTVMNLYFEDYQNDPLFKNVKEVNLDYAFFLSHHADNSVKNKFSLVPRDERYLNFLAYFGQLLNMNNDDLLGIVPYEVNLKDLSIGLNVKVDDDSVAKVINGKVVALCQRLEPDNKVFTLADTPLRCFGAGLIRGVDCEKEVLYIITPVEAVRLADVNCLVYGDWVPELRGDTVSRGVPAGTPLPYRTASEYQQRHFMLAPKRRFNPLQLIKMSRNLN